MAIKNLWSLTVDEALFVDNVKGILKKSKFGVFLPANSQPGNVDLLSVDLSKMKCISIPVKRGRTYEPGGIGAKKFGYGSGARFVMKDKTINSPTNQITFLLYP